MRIDVGGRSNDINSGSHDAALRGKQEENNIEIGRAMYSNVSALILRWYQPAQTETCSDILRKLIRVKLSILLCNKSNNLLYTTRPVQVYVHTQSFLREYCTALRIRRDENYSSYCMHHGQSDTNDAASKGREKKWITTFRQSHLYLPSNGWPKKGVPGFLSHRGWPLIIELINGDNREGCDAIRGTVRLSGAE